MQQARRAGATASERAWAARATRVPWVVQYLSVAEDRAVVACQQSIHHLVRAAGVHRLLADILQDAIELRFKTQAGALSWTPAGRQGKDASSVAASYKSCSACNDCWAPKAP